MAWYFYNVLQLNDGFRVYFVDGTTYIAFLKYSVNLLSVPKFSYLLILGPPKLRIYRFFGWIDNEQFSYTIVSRQIILIS